MALHNLARMTSATTGTGTLTLGSAVSGFLSFADAGVADGETVTYAIRDGANSEVTRGVYTASGTTLTRGTVLESTNGGAAINCSGSQEVFITAAAEDIGLASDKKTITSGDLTTTSTSFADIDANLNITITTGRRRCLAVCNAVGILTVGTGNISLDLEVDGARQGQTFGLAFSGGLGSVNFNLSFSYITDVLSVGSHTFEPQWRVDGGTGKLYASTTIVPLYFSVVELPNW